MKEEIATEEFALKDLIFKEKEARKAKNRIENIFVPNKNQAQKEMREKMANELKPLDEVSKYCLDKAMELGVVNAKEMKRLREKARK